jgi:hypothetical protein
MLTLRRLALPVLLASIAGCTAVAGGPSAPGTSAAPSASAALSITSPDAAAARVMSVYPRFAGLGHQNADAVGQCCWYEASSSASGYQVVVHVGWGDCPAGCISKHEWTYRVTPDGSVSTINETGSDVPAGILPVVGAPERSPAALPSGTSGIAGRATAGPTCPVVRVADSTCDPRALPGASIVVRNSAGAIVARQTAAADGSFAIALPPGSYTVEGESVGRFPAAPAPATVSVVFGVATAVEIMFDTGIR